MSPDEITEFNNQYHAPWDPLHAVCEVAHDDMRFKILSENPGANILHGMSWVRVDGVLTIGISDVRSIPVGHFSNFFLPEAPRIRCVIERLQ